MSAEILRELREQIEEQASDIGLPHVESGCAREASAEELVEALARDLADLGVDPELALEVAGISAAIGVFLDRCSLVERTADPLLSVGLDALLIEE